MSETKMTRLRARVARLDPDTWTVTDKWFLAVEDIDDDDIPEDKASLLLYIRDSETGIRLIKAIASAILAKEHNCEVLLTGRLSSGEYNPYVMVEDEEPREAENEAWSALDSFARFLCALTEGNFARAEDHHSEALADWPNV